MNFLILYRKTVQNLEFILLINVFKYTFSDFLAQNADVRYLFSFDDLIQFDVHLKLECIHAV